MPDKRVNITRRDEVRALLDSYKLLRIAFIVLVLVTTGALYWQNDTAGKASTAADNANNAIAQIQAERKRNTLSACESSNAKNAAIRGFVLNSLPAEIRDKAAVKRYLDKHLADFNSAPVAGRTPRPPGNDQQVPAAYIVAYLERLRVTFPEANCERVVAQTVKASKR